MYRGERRGNRLQTSGGSKCLIACCLLMDRVDQTGARYGDILRLETDFGKQEMNEVREIRVAAVTATARDDIFSAEGR